VLDLRFIRENAEKVKKNAALRSVACDVDRIIELVNTKNQWLTQVQDLQRQQNEVARRIKSAASSEERERCVQTGKQLRAQVNELETRLAQLEPEILQEQSRVPNLTHPDAPHGIENVVVRAAGAIPKFDFKPRDHVELCALHDWADFEAAAKVAGSSFYFLKGELALLQLALVSFAMRTLVAEGFTAVITPDLARSRVLEGTGYIPRGPETQIYRLADYDLGLIATAEITLAGMLADEILAAERLPIKFVGLSHCFRTEAGAHGRATRGLFRVHQFTKVEMFAFTRPEQSESIHEEMLRIEEQLFQRLEIPYRVVDICAAELGGPAYRKYDLEAWMPGRGEAGEYAEVTSTSNCTDYQARRLGIRFKLPGEKGTRFVHMLNGTAIAASRALIAILENHQRSDGSVRVPTALVPYMGVELMGGAS
jgi:seryl-tRNA synthetase